MTPSHAKASDCRSLIPVAKVAKKKKRVSKNQQTFLKLTKKIEEIQKSIKRKTKQSEDLLKIYIEEVHPREMALAKTMVKIAKQIGESTRHIKFGRQQRLNLQTAILMLCDEAFRVMPPDEETQQFYNMWANKYDDGDGEGNEYDIQKRTIATGVRNKYGIHIDPDDFENTAEGLGRFTEHLRGEFARSRKERESADDDDRSGRHGYEDSSRSGQFKVKQKADANERSIRAVFIALAKILHPDTSTDTKEKARKEEMMKKVTAAYACRDLPALLKIEVECIKAMGKKVTVLPEKLLKSYISSLKQQIRQLEEEFGQIHLHARYRCIAPLLNYPHHSAVREIYHLAKNRLKYSQILEETIDTFSGPQPKYAILEFAREFITISHAVEASYEF